MRMEKKLAKCISRIIYNKVNNTYTLNKPHSEFCEIRNNDSYHLYTNIAEVKNYKNFKE